MAVLMYVTGTFVANNIVTAMISMALALAETVTYFKTGVVVGLGRYATKYGSGTGAVMFTQEKVHE